FDAMTDLPKPLRLALAEAFVPLSSRVARHLRASDETHKLLLELRDGKLVECVLIQDEGRRTACVSTQVGCGMGCVFGASGLAGVLHAPTDALRTQIVPTNDKTGLPAILEAADEFFERTGRQVTFEYVLLGGLNDQVSHARELARLLHGRKAHVNLIPFNDVE